MSLLFESITSLLQGLLDGVDLQEVFNWRLRVMQCYLFEREREVSTSHQVCIGGQTQGSPISGQDLGDPCVEVVLFVDPILAGPNSV